jgi:hypothetical protein
MKLAIRTDQAAGVIRAYFSSLDDRLRFEVSTLALGLARDDPAAFEAWKDAMAQALRRALEGAGVTVLGMNVVKPEEKN